MKHNIFTGGICKPKNFQRSNHVNNKMVNLMRLLDILTMHVLEILLFRIRSPFLFSYHCPICEKVLGLLIALKNILLNLLKKKSEKKKSSSHNRFTDVVYVYSLYDEWNKFMCLDKIWAENLTCQRARQKHELCVFAFDWSCHI